MKRPFFVGLLFAALVLMLAPSVFAQQECWSCTPEQDCSTECYYCQPESPDGYCPQYAVHYSTCGEQGMSCSQSSCTPYWVEISREVQGTYGEGYTWFGCSHHSVEWVTQEDLNHCNTDPYYWYNYYCHDETDGWKFLMDNGGLDCCNGLGPDGLPDSLFTCNHYHSCTG